MHFSLQKKKRTMHFGHNLVYSFVTINVKFAVLTWLKQKKTLNRCTQSVPNIMATDGILGLGQNELSIISQLNSQGLSPKVFSHCLKGSEEGGGIFVLGKIVSPRLVFTPLVSYK
jgi:hypothetical protein